MASKFLVLGSLALLLLVILPEAHSQTVSLSFNTSTVILGRRVSLKWTLNDFTPLTVAYKVALFADSDSTPICHYEIPAGPSSTKQPKFTALTAGQEAWVIPLWAGMTSGEIGLIPTKLGTQEYRLIVTEPTGASTLLSSTQVPLKVVKSLPEVTFSVQSTPTLNSPFTGTCTIGNFNPTPASGALKYQITFYRFYADHPATLLATYSMQGLETGEATLERHDGLRIHAGDRAIYPAFDLAITEQTAPTGEYWCKLSENRPAGSGVPSFENVTSDHWTNGPVVSFTSVRVNTVQRYGACDISNFNPTGKDLSVKFLTTHGGKPEKPEILLGTFLMKPNKILEFDSEEKTGWTTIISGQKVEYPQFRITAEAFGLSKTWWCVLGVGTPGSAEYREYKSRTADLA